MCADCGPNNLFIPSTSALGRKIGTWDKIEQVATQAFLDQVSSQLVAVGGADYASEIENAVGEEIYGPIFKAGVFLFVSGVVAAFGVAFIVSKSDSWNDLQDEFDVGKQKQLISSDAEIDMAAASQNAASSEPVVTENAKDTGRGQRNEDGIDIDSLDL